MAGAQAVIEEHKTVFISYRREPAWAVARLIYNDLHEHGYEVFMDVESLGSGMFDIALLRQIEARAHFILILTPGTVDRCAELGDWLRREIEHAMETQRNIVPLFVYGFSFDGTEKYLTGKLNQLRRYNGLPLDHIYFDDGMEKLRSRFLKQPLYGKIKPALDSDQEFVERKIAEAAAQPLPTEQELSAEVQLIKGVSKTLVEGDHEGAIEVLSELILRNNQNAGAYYWRGEARSRKGDLYGAVSDYTEGIRLKPNPTEFYQARGDVFYEMGEIERAITDYSEAIRLNRNDIENYKGRGYIRYKSEDMEGAVADYTEAIRLDPEDSYAHEGRAEAHFVLGHYEQALSDFEKADELFPDDNKTLAGLAITYWKLWKREKAIYYWRALVEEDEQFFDADWVGKEFKWAEPLIDVADRLTEVIDLLP